MWAVQNSEEAASEDEERGLKEGTTLLLDRECHRDVKSALLACIYCTCQGKLDKTGPIVAVFVYCDASMPPAQLLTQCLVGFLVPLPYS